MQNKIINLKGAGGPMFKVGGVGVSYYNTYIPVIVQNVVSFPIIEASNKSIELQNSAV